MEVLDKAHGKLDKDKRDRIETDIQTKLAFRKISMRSMPISRKIPSPTQKKQPDSTDEAQLRSVLDTAKAGGEKYLADARSSQRKRSRCLNTARKSTIWTD